MAVSDADTLMSQAWRNIQTFNGDADMANQTFSLSANTVSTGATTEGTIAGLKGDAMMVTEQVNAPKLATYAELISAITGGTLTKGN